ncbi:MAG: hypothetical protein ABI270_03625 [Nitrosospira sp.]
MAIRKRNPPGRRLSAHKPSRMEKEEEAGKLPPYAEGETLPAEHVELAKPERETRSQASEKTLLPHERDQSTGLQGTGLGNENDHSQALIGQAAADTEHGLKDTDLHGIPSDIIASDASPSNVPEKAYKKKR